MTMTHRANQAPISSNDVDAIELLQEKIAGLEAYQAQMKACNKIVKNNKIDDAEKIAQIQAYGLTHDDAWRLLQPDYSGRVGYPSYALTNNNATIRNAKKRITAIGIENERREDVEPVTEVTHTIGGLDIKIQEDIEDNRLRIIFQEKPNYDTRKILKGNGFVWAPSQDAWQRQLNNQARYSADNALNSIRYLH